MEKASELYTLIWMSRPLMQAAEAAVDRGLKDTGLTVRMRAVLEMLYKHGDLSVPELALKLDINRQYVQVMVNETLVAGFAVKKRNPRHKRSDLLSLTGRGLSLIEHVINRERVFLTSIENNIDTSDVIIAIDVVTALITQLKLYTQGQSE